MDVKKEFKELIVELENVDLEDDNKIEELWNQEINLLSRDIAETIDYLKTECTENEYSFISEILIELIEKTQSKDLLDAYESLSSKFPEETKKYHITSFIEDARKEL